MSGTARYYGSMELTDSGWAIKAEPHVMVRIKRLFRRAEGQYGEIVLANTDETCRDLAWLITRYPLRVKGKKRLIEGAARFDKRNSEAAALLAGKIQPRTIEAAIPPREYQAIAADLALRMNGLLITDAVGLGKTAEAIYTLTNPERRPALAVTLTDLPEQWEAEVHKFLPGIRTHVLKKGVPYSLVPRSDPMQGDLLDPEIPDVLICNYAKLAGWAEHLGGVIKTLILDECQSLRHLSTRKRDAAKHIVNSGAMAVGLSATPIYNYGDEFWSVLDVIRPGALGTRTEFLAEWCEHEFGGKAKIKDTKAFSAYLREQGLMLRRTRKDVGRELPPVIKSVHYIEADTEALEAVSGSAAELARTILRQGGTGFEKMRAGSELDWRLRQATGISKARYVADFVRLLVESGEKVILYGWHHEVYNLWGEQLRDLNPVFYTGRESARQKREAKQAFIEGDAQVFIMSLRAGAGLEGLQKASHVVVFGEIDWSHGIHEQCIGRADREDDSKAMEEQETVVAYFLLSTSGSDPVIADTLGLKRAQLTGVLDPDADLVEKLEGGASIRRLAAEYLKQIGFDPGPAGAAALAGAELADVGQG